MRPHLLFLGAVALAAARQQAFSAQDGLMLSPEVDAFIESTLLEWGSPGGLGVAVVKLQEDGQWQVEKKGYGNATSDGKKVSPDTWFAIGSNSKLFDVLATGLLISNETLSPRISWDSTIASMLPSSIWNLSDPIAASQSTIVDLMAHRTGFPAHNQVYALNETIYTFGSRLEYLKASAPFRTVYQYTSNMYTILGHLPTALLPHRPNLATYLKEHIFEPLGLNNTTFSNRRAVESGFLAEGFGRDAMQSALDEGIPRVVSFWPALEGEDGMSFLSGAGGLVMSVNDAAVWLQTLLLNGRNPATNGVVIPAEVLTKVSTGVTVVPGASIHPSLSPAVYGGGQKILSYQGHVLIEHGGAIPGFRTVIARLPNDGLGVAVFSNDETHGTNIIDILRWRLVEHVLGLPHVDWNGIKKAAAQSAYATRMTKIRTPLPESPRVPWSAVELEGTYTDKAYGDILLCSLPTTNPACPPLNFPAPTRPTLVAQWDKLSSSHLRLEHFDGDVWNVTLLAVEELETGEVWLNQVEDFYTGTFSEDGRGFGLTGGFWGTGPGFPEPGGETVKERSEVWFEKV